MGRLFWGFVAGLALCVAAQAAAGASGTGKTIYAGVTVISADAPNLRPRMAIIVEGERISAILPMTSLTGAQRQGAKVIDEQGLYALPGLIDSHVHLATDPGRAYAEAELRRELYGGVTAVRDMAGDARMLADLSRASMIGAIDAPDIFYSALMAGPDFFSDPRTASAARGLTPGQVPWLQSIAPGTDLRLAVAMARGTSAAGIKIYADLDGDLVRGIIAEAKRQGFPVWTHLQVYPATPYDSLGANSVSHVCMLATSRLLPGKQRYDHSDDGDFTRLDPADPEIARYGRALKASGTVLDATLSLYEPNPKPPKPGRFAGCSRSLAAAILRVLSAQGVTVSAGTDYPAATDQPFPSLYDELDSLVHDAGFTPLQAITAATRNGAMAAGVTRDYGDLAPGKVADIVFVRRNPLDDIDNLRTIFLTVKRGAAYRRDDYHFAPIKGAEP